MLSQIVFFSIHSRGIVIAFYALMLIYGAHLLSQTGLSIFPEFAPKQVIVQTESPGFSSEQVEILVTQKIENALGGLGELTNMYSESIQGLSVVTAIFNESSDPYRIRQQVSERLATIANRLPEGVNSPLVVPLSSSSATILTIGLTSDEHNLMDLRTLADWTITPRLLNTPGVADINIFGGEVKQLQIQIDPVELQRNHLTTTDVIKAAKGAGSATGFGFLENDNQRLTLSFAGQADSPEKFRQLVLKRGEKSVITLGDVATIVFAPEPPISAAAIQGKTGIVMMIIGQYGANTLTVTQNVETALTELDTLLSMQGIQLHPHLFRPADYIETSLTNLSQHLLLGGVLVILVLYLFLFNYKTALISAISIPLSLTGAAIVLVKTGVELNIMVLGGLAIALGEVVDDAIIDTENIFRRLRENSKNPEPAPRWKVIYKASLEVRSSVVYASFIVALVFTPLLTLGGVTGRLFSPLGISYILAILMSLAVALTATPALCCLLLKQDDNESRGSPLIRWIRPGYSTLLRKIATIPKLSIFISGIFCIAGLTVLPTLNSQFLPELREGHYIVHTSSIPGTSLQESLRIGRNLTEMFRKIPGVESVSQWAGRAERGADTYGSHYSEFEVRLNTLSGSEQQAILDQIRSTLENFPGIHFEANTFLTERVDETISGYSAPVAVNIFGKDLAELDEKAAEIVSIMGSIKGAKDVQVRSAIGTPDIAIQLQLPALAHWGMRPSQVMDSVQAAYQGKWVSTFHQGNRTIDVSVILPQSYRSQPQHIGQLPLVSPSGQLLTLSQVATIQQSGGRYNILHRGAQRVQTITCHISGRDFDDFIDELKEQVLTKIEFSLDTYPEFTGAAIEQKKTRNTLISQSLTALAGVFMLIYMATGNFRNTLLTLVNLPFSLVGGVFAVVLSGASLSVGSVIGFVTLFGITVRNAIMLITHYQHLITVEAKPWNLDTAIQGATERLPSILMTALVTALAMLPIAFDSDNPGREIMGPMATIIIGGLATSTLLNLILFPVLLFHFGQYSGTKN